MYVYLEYADISKTTVMEAAYWGCIILLHLLPSAEKKKGAQMKRVTPVYFSISSVIGIVIVAMLLGTLSVNAKRKNCAHRASAVLRGNENVGPAGMQFKVSQTIIVAKQDKKKALIGKWVATEWDYVQVSPRSASSTVAKAVMSAVNSMPTIRIPGISAKCTTMMTDSRTITWHCVGKYPFEIDTNGDIIAGQQRIGKFTKGSDEITLSVVPMNPAFRGTVTGLVNRGNTIRFVPKFTSVRHRLEENSVRYELDISLKPQNKKAGNALRVKAAYTGKDPYSVFIATKKKGSKVHLSITLKSGNQNQRLKLASGITITANTVFHGCPFSIKWTFLDLMFSLDDRY